MVSQLLKTNMKISCLFLPLFAISIFSCSSVSPRSEKIRMIRNDSGEMWILPYIIIGTDTLTDGKAVCYSSTRKIKEEIQYKKGAKDGWDMRYDSSGALESRILYKSGFKSGYGTFYGIKGEIQKKYFIEDKLVEEERMNNQVIPIQYRVFAENGDVQYVVLFDSLGNKFYENGFVFEDSVHFDKFRKDSLTVDLPVEIKIFTTQLPGYSRGIRLECFNQLNKKANVATEVRNDDFYTTIKFTPKIIGRQTISIIGILEDKTGKVVKKDTLYQAIMVY